MPRQLEDDGLRLAFLKQNLLETLELPHRAHTAGNPVMNIQLYDFLDSPSSRVRDIASDCQDAVPGQNPSQNWGSILNRAVREPMAEGVQGLVRHSEIAVRPSTRPQAWASRAHAIIIQRLLSPGDWECDRQATRGAVVSKEHVCNRMPRHLAQEPGFVNSWNIARVVVKEQG